MVNVDPKKQDDPYYRYKMPAAQIKIEGSGNGIKTVIPNIRDICKVLKRPEEFLLKFLGNELGALSNFVKSDDKFLVMGQHTQERVQELVFRFIEKYILCSACRNPETDVHVAVTGKNTKIHLECRACSKKTAPPLADKTYKFFSETYASIHKAQKAEDKKKKKGDEKPASPTTATAPAEGEEKPNSEKPAEKNATIQSTEEERENPVDILGRTLASGSYNVDTTANQVHRLKTEYNLKDANVVRLVIRASVQQAEKNAGDESVPRFIEAIRINLNLIKRFVEKKGDNAYIFIREIQLLCHKHKCPERFMMAMKLLVEEEIIEDQEVLKWHTAKAKDVPEDFNKTLKEKCNPLVEWLKAQE